MTLHKPLTMQPAGGDPDLTYTGAEERALLTALYPFQGVIPPGRAAPAGFAVTQRGAGANFSVDVAAGLAAVLGDDVASQGTYLCWSDATFNLSTPGAPGSGTRLHRVGLQVRDKLNNGSFTQYDFTPLVVQDTGAGFPAEPASFLTLAQVSIAAAQANVSNANITDMRACAGPRQAVLAGNSGPRTSQVLTAEPGLSMWLAASATYRVEMFLKWTTATPSHFLISWNRPSGATGGWGANYTAGGSIGTAPFGWGWSFQGDFISQASSVTDNAVFLSGTMVTTSAGLWQLNWTNRDTGTLTLQLGSYLLAEQVA